MKTVLITGFGPFPGVADNPSARLARALDGRVVGGVRFVGEVLPVSYRRAPAQTLRLAAAHKADAILGTGVARGEAPSSRSGPSLGGGGTSRGMRSASGPAPALVRTMGSANVVASSRVSTPP